MTTGVKKFGSYNVVYKSSGLDTRAFPASGCPNYVLGDGSTSKVCLTDAQIEKELKSVIASHHLPTGLGNQYFLFTPQGVASCSNAAGLSPTAVATTRCSSTASARSTRTSVRVHTW